MITPGDRLLNSSEAAALLSISTRTLAKLRESNAIPIVRINGNRKGIRYSSKSLDEFISSRSQNVAGN